MVLTGYLSTRANSDALLGIFDFSYVRMRVRL
jgi:hypothetical protein